MAANEADVTSQGRFAIINDAEMKTILENVDAKNTKRVTTTAVKLFRDYLTFKGESADFENFTCEKLDELLGKFYVEARTKDGDMYKKSTMLSYRQGLQRFLEKHRDIDISKGDEFKKSTKAFKCISKELKKQGLAVINHYPAISDDHLEAIYDYLTPRLEDAQTLQYKVNISLLKIYMNTRSLISTQVLY
jgi:hypothetical protein